MNIKKLISKAQSLSLYVNPPLLLAVVVFFISSIILAGVVRYSEHDRLLHERMTALNMADGYTDAIQGKIEHALSANYVMAALVRQGHGRIENFEKIATQMLPIYPGVSSLALSPEGIIQINVPLAENAKSIGFNPFKNPQQNKEAFLTRNTGKLTLAGPFELVQGGFGVVGRLPVFLENKEEKASFWGFTNVVIRIPQIFASIGLKQLQGKGYAYEVWRIDPYTNKKQTILASSASALETPVIKTMQLANTVWYFGVTPIQGWANPLFLLPKLLLALALSLLLAFLAKLMLELKIHKQELEKQVGERTNEVLATKNQLQATLDAVPDLLFEVGLDGRYYSFHSPRTDLLAVPAEELMGKLITDIMPADACNVCFEALQEANASGFSHAKCFGLQLAQGKKYFELSVSRKAAESGQAPRFIVLSRDITERKNSEAKIRRLSNIYAALSQCNQAIVRCSDEAALFPQICRDAIRFGGFKMAWIGLLDAETGAVKPVAYDGDGSEYLQDIRVTIDAKSPFGRGPIGTAMREDHPVWSQDCMNDATCAPWHERAIKYGWQSVASLPIHRGGSVVGSFNLYSSELHAFDEAARDLLIEMAMDISFALKNFALEAQRKKADEALRASEQHLRTLVETEPECVKLLDARGQLLEMNAAGLAMLEVDTLEEAQQYNMQDMVLPEYQAAFADLHKRVMRGETAALEFEINGLRGTRRWLETRAAPMRDQNGKVISLLGITRDITVRKRTDDSLKRHAERLEQAEKNANLGSWEFDVVGGRGWWSQHMFHMFGFAYATDMPSCEEYLERIHPEDRDIVQEVLISMAMGEVPQCREFKSNPAYGSIRYFMPTLSAETDAQGKIIKFTGTQLDITQQKLAEKHILHLANYDALTGLPNRTLLTDRVVHAISMAQRSKEPLSLMFLDLDHFKNVNDSLGHKIGDELLISLAGRLRGIVREEDTISRLGGDEFILVLPATNADGAAHVADKLLQTIAKPYQVDQYELIVTPSIGIAMYPNDGEDFEVLSKCADSAMYRAKAGGRNTYRFFTPEMQERSVRTLQLENALRYAVEDNQLLLEYQPQIALKNGQVIGAEALLRWQHPKFGLISPNEFIPLAESTGQILQIGEWVLRTASLQLRNWIDLGFAPITMAVNLSAVQFRYLQLPDLVTQILHEAGVAAQYLELELTEGVAMENPLAAVSMMDQLHARGIRMSIDDFGTGYSSLSYLKRFQVYKLKIDRSFVRDITHDPEDMAIVCAIINLAKNLGLQTIAEGVETMEQLEFLQQKGCDEVQGYYFSKPLPAVQFEAFMRDLSGGKNNS